MLMAGHDQESDSANNPQSNAINQLRNLAQQHREEIDEGRTRESQDELKKIQDLEKYAKLKSSKGSKTTTQCDSPLPKMRSAQGKSRRSLLKVSTDCNTFRRSSAAEVGCRA